MKLNRFNLKFSFYILLTFIVFTIIGTLTHELGHIAVAKYLGYKTSLSFGSMYYEVDGFEEDEDVKKHKELYIKNSYEIENHLPFEDEEILKFHFRNIQDKYAVNEKDGLLITLGGPLQTILTCIIGFYILFYRKSKQKVYFKLLDWLGVFLSLFILREVFNTIMALFKTVFFGAKNFAGDEFGISRLLGLNQWVVPIITMFIGIAISVYIIFKVIPKRHQFSFILSGFIGGVLGYSIWFGFLGSLLFPTPISF